MNFNAPIPGPGSVSGISQHETLNFQNIGNPGSPGKINIFYFYFYYYFCFMKIIGYMEEYISPGATNEKTTYIISDSSVKLLASAISFCAFVYLFYRILDKNTKPESVAKSLPKRQWR